ncbi:MAG: aspartate-semialdehyde dehydrogenase [Pseudomonadota bacterium]
MSRALHVAVVGATGLVGRTMLSILEERSFSSGRIVPVASARSRGRRLTIRGEQVTVEVLEEFDFAGIDIALFSPGGTVSGEYAPKAAASGCIVIDNTSRFRYDDDVPLVVPEVNGHAIAECRQRNIIANPNCSTIQMVMALQPIYANVGIARINVATYQAVSGAGQSALAQLAHQAEAVVAGRRPEESVPLAFNAVPQIDVFQDNGYTREEMKMVWETRKILGDERIAVNPTAVRVPVHYGHSEAIHLETLEPAEIEQVRDWLRVAPGVELIDDRAGDFPTAWSHAAGRDPVYVGRVRRDLTHPRGIDMWVVSDNVRKGAALNSVQIAEVLADSYW